MGRQAVIGVLNLSQFPEMVYSGQAMPSDRADVTVQSSRVGISRNRGPRRDRNDDSGVSCYRALQEIGERSERVLESQEIPGILALAPPMSPWQQSYTSQLAGTRDSNKRLFGGVHFARVHSGSLAPSLF